MEQFAEVEKLLMKLVEQALQVSLNLTLMMLVEKETEPLLILNAYVEKEDEI